MILKRILEGVAMLVIGDSLMCLLAPKRHVSLWRGGPRWWRQALHPFLQYPTLTRVCGAVGIVLGIFLAERQEPMVENPSVFDSKWERLKKLAS